MVVEHLELHVVFRGGEARVFQEPNHESLGISHLRVVIGTQLAITSRIDWKCLGSSGS
jgi:hypothetical protein